MADRKPAAESLERRVLEMERRLAEAEARVQALEAKEIKEFQPLARSAAPASRQWIPMPGPEAARTAPASPAKPVDLERMIGANWLSKLGMVVLVLGVAFFLRYAFEQGWITIPGRVVLGVLGGLAIFAAGDLLRWWDETRFSTYGQVLAGGGAAITFFSLFAAYQFPTYRAATGMTLEADALLLGATGALLAVYATIRKTPVLLIEAVGLGAVASIFGASFSFFSVVYTVVLGGAVAAAATWRQWSHVLVATVFASLLNLVVLHAQNVDAAVLLAGTVGLLLVFTIAPLSGRSMDPGRTPLLWGIFTGASWIGAWSLALLSLDRGIGLGIDTWDGPFTGAVALGAVLLAWRGRTNPNARWGWAAAFGVSSLVWPALQFEDQWQAFGWAALSALGTAVLYWKDRAFLRGYLAIVGAVLLARLVSVEVFRLMDGTLSQLDGAAPFALGTIALLGTWFVAGRKGTRAEPLARSVLALGLALPVAYALGALDGFAVPIAWTLEAVVLVVAGFWFSQRDLRIASLALFGLVLARIFLVDLLGLDLAVRIVTFLVVGGLLLLASFLFARRQRGEPASSSMDPPH